jgi:hypothetical protein
MKAEERKQLQKNDLVAGIEKLMTTVKEGPSNNTVMYSTLAVVAVALVVILISTWIYFTNESKSAAALRWEDLNSINSANEWSVNPDELERFAKDPKNAGTPQARLARFELARYWVQDARKLASDPFLMRAEAISNVKKGRDLYKELANESGDVPAQAQEALMGAAKGSETIGEIDEARKYYEKLQKEYPQSVYGQEAAKQLKRLADNKDFDALKKMLLEKGS